NIKNNGSLYLHVVVSKSRYSIDPSEHESDSPQYTFWKSKRLNKYRKKVYRKTKNLLTGSTEKDEEYQKVNMKFQMVRILFFTDEYLYLES
ncbi:unnamed protein product, partial [Rotaria magnacalcarata]